SRLGWGSLNNLLSKGLNFSPIRTKKLSSMVPDRIKLLLRTVVQAFNFNQPLPLILQFLD
ncbi:hypothetical protein, partial [Streptococcus sobrinus]|uniref:hypothetical protein n=1 Tax=Streptococcus sobrinus TaxID=1310 RepID=UPI0004976337